MIVSNCIPRHHRRKPHIHGLRLGLPGLNLPPTTLTYSLIRCTSSSCASLHHRKTLHPSRADITLRVPCFGRSIVFSCLLIRPILMITSPNSSARPQVTTISSLNRSPRPSPIALSHKLFTPQYSILLRIPPRCRNHTAQDSDQAGGQLEGAALLQGRRWRPTGPHVRQPRRQQQQ